MAEPPPAPAAAVVLNWNGIADTRRCLASLLAADGPDPVVVVDNGSGNGEGEALRREFAGDRRVRVLPLPRNLGFAGGVNAGVRAAREAGAAGADLLLLNNDAVLEPGALEALRAALAADPGAAAAGPRILLDDGSGRLWFGGGRIARGIGVAVHEGVGGLPREEGGAPRPCGFLTFCAVLLRGGAWDAVGPLDEEYFAYWEDADWCARAAASGRRLLHVPGAVARHRVSAAAGHRSPFQAYLLARGHVLFARKRLGGAARALAFWPWMVLLRGPHVFLRNLATGRPAAGAAFLRGLRDGARGGPPAPP